MMKTKDNIRRYNKRGVGALVISVLTLLAASPAMAQDSRISLPVKTLSAREVFDNIQRQTNYLIAADGENMSHLKATITQSPVPVKTVLAQLLDGSGMDYQVEDRYIIITESKNEPAKTPAPVVRTPRPQTNDQYSRSSFAMLDAKPRPRPVEIPREEVKVVPEPVLEPTPEIEQSSFYKPLEDYAANSDKLPTFVAKTNLLYGGATLTPNLGIEIGLGRRTSLEFTGSYNPWNLKGSLESNKKLVHMILKPEFRYWFCERYNGHFVGVDAIYARYNIGTHTVPLLFDKKYRYDGTAIGGGITYGYQWMLGKRIGLEVAVGAGYMKLDYDRYDCAACNRDGVKMSKTYFGPTNAAVNLVFLIK